MLAADKYVVFLWVHVFPQVRDDDVEDNLHLLRIGSVHSNRI
jgi:hypothetical protein